MRGAVSETCEPPQQRVVWRWGLEPARPEDLLYRFPAECPALESCLMHSRPSASVLTERLETVQELPGDGAEVHREGVPRLNLLGLENGTVLTGGLAHRRFGSEGDKGRPGLLQGKGRAGRGPLLAPGQRPRGRKETEGRRGVAGVSDVVLGAPLLPVARAAGDSGALPQLHQARRQPAWRGGYRGLGKEAGLHLGFEHVTGARMNTGLRKAGSVLKVTQLATEPGFSVTAF